MAKESKTGKMSPEAQSARFIEAARELGCDESPDAFEAAVKKVARHKAGEKKLPQHRPVQKDQR